MRLACSNGDWHCEIRIRPRPRQFAARARQARVASTPSLDLGPPLTSLRCCRLDRDTRHTVRRSDQFVQPRELLQFFTGGATHVVTIDADWLDAAIDSSMTIYELPSEQFQLLDVSAGYWVSRVEVKPLNMLEVRRPLSEIVKRGVEVRVVPKLWDLREPVVRSTVDYSIIRMKDPPSG